MLENARIPSHEGRCREPKYLPEREIPRHDRQNDSDRLERNPALATLHLHRLVGEKALGVFRVVPTGCRALLGLSDARSNRLSHFQRHQPSELAAFGVQNRRGFLHPLCTLGEWHAAMFPVCSDRPIKTLAHPSGGERLEGANRFAGCWIDRRDCHSYFARRRSRLAILSTGRLGSVKSISCQGTSYTE